MKKEYKHITITQEAKPVGKHPSFNITNNRSGDLLGVIGWYTPWKMYVAQFRLDTVWSAGCLADVQDFINNHAKE